MNKVLYLTRNGLLEPLGQSQIYPYLKGLSKSVKITLISFEKPSDFTDRLRLRVVREECKRMGIDWIALRYRETPRPWAPFFSITQLFIISIYQWSKKERPDLIHSRSYVPAAVSIVLHRLTGIPFIFDMRALWAEELITAGRILRGSLIHRLIQWIERNCLQEASAVVSLTNSGLDYLKVKYSRELLGQRVLVIPTCVDLDRFKPDTIEYNDELVIGCIGTVLSGWFCMDWLREFFNAVIRTCPMARFELISRDPAQEILRILNPSRDWQEKLVIKAAKPEDMPSIVRGHTASVMFYAGGNTSELGRSPTRMAEVLSCGRPVVASHGVGDVGEIIRKEHVGVLARGKSPIEMDNCVTELLDLLGDPKLSERCRRTAEKYFSLCSGTSMYRKLYESILLNAELGT